MRRVSILLITAVVAIAGCGSDDEEGAPAQASAVSVESVEGSDVLVDREGRTLYTAAVEEGGKILCTGGCVSFWAPVPGSAGDAGSSDLDLGTVERPDGASQLTYKGLPLYTFTEEGAGELTGDGFVDDFKGTTFEWQAARADGGGGDSTSSPGGGYGY
jgi:predicted lipoprotein with Yx(FWY)xxD motif